MPQLYWFFTSVILAMLHLQTYTRLNSRNYRVITLAIKNTSRWRR